MSEKIIPICDDPLAINHGEPLPCEYSDAPEPSSSGGCSSCNGGGNGKTPPIMKNKTKWIWILIGAIAVYYLIRKFGRGGN